MSVYSLLVRIIKKTTLTFFHMSVITEGIYFKLEQVVRKGSHTKGACSQQNSSDTRMPSYIFTLSQTSPCFYVSVSSPIAQSLALRT